jgi:hypothetical protein
MSFCRHRDRAALVVCVTLLLTGAACYSPSIQDCSITCGAAGDCPSGTQCGADNRCHVDLSVSCLVPAGDGGALDSRPAPPDGLPGTPDGHPAPPDGHPAPPDGHPAPPDGRPELPDASLPDAGSCSNARAGEPDDTCPGDHVGPVHEGTTFVLDGRRIFPTGDVDIMDVPLNLKSVASCPPSRIVNYALIVTLTPPPDAELRLERFGSDRICAGPREDVGTEICVPFFQFCSGPATLNPEFFFAVSGADGAASCTAYSVSFKLCAAGSTCDNCIQL